MEPSTIRNLQNVAGCWWVANYPGQGGHWRGAQCPVVPRLMVPGGDQGCPVVTPGHNYTGDRRMFHLNQAALFPHRWTLDTGQ